MNHQKHKQNAALSVVILAAGTSSRMASGANKMLLRNAEGVSVLERTLRQYSACGFAELLCVTGRDNVETSIIATQSGATPCFNPFYAERGMASSIVCGVRAASPSSQGVIIGLGDMPFVSSADILCLCDAFWQLPNALSSQQRRICIPVFGGRRGNPVLFSALYTSELLALHGDFGAKSILARHAAECIEVPLSSNACLIDIDTEHDAHRFFHSL